MTPNRKRQINETAIDVTKKKKTKKEKKREETGTLSIILETGIVGREEERQQL